MTLPRLYHQGPLTPGETVCLNEAKSHHVLTVLRMRVSEPCIIFNGDGAEYRATIIAGEKKQATLSIDSKESVRRESPLEIHLIQALSRGSKMDDTIQKAVQLGVTKITPIFSDLCDVKLTQERQMKKLAHWQEIIVHASEQCGRLKLATLNPPVKYAQVLNQSGTEVNLLFHHLEKESFSLPSTAPRSVSLLIGPEAGFTEKEVSQALEHNWQCLLLGPRTLRTEVAGVVGCAMIQTLWGDFFTNSPSISS